MKPEIFAKIMQIVRKRGERVIVIDPQSGDPFVIMNLEEYERLGPNTGPLEKSRNLKDLTPNTAPGIIDPDLALWQEAQKTAKGGDWGGDEANEQDRYYIEPAE